jgi:hypothetical protein
VCQRMVSYLLQIRQGIFYLALAVAIIWVASSGHSPSLSSSIDGTLCNFWITNPVVSYAVPDRYVSFVSSQCLAGGSHQVSAIIKIAIAVETSLFLGFWLAAISFIEAFRISESKKPDRVLAYIVGEVELSSRRCSLLLSVQSRVPEYSALRCVGRLLSQPRTLAFPIPTTSVGRKLSIRPWARNAPRWCRRRI